MHLTGLHLLLTYRCTYECDHCFVYSSPRAEATMSLRLATDAIRQAAGLGTVEEIWIEGGEPFLYYPVLLAVVRKAKEHGLASGIVTNGYFAETADDATLWLEPLKQAGLGTLSVSDDAFHSEVESPDTPAKRTIEAARRLSIDVGAICIEPPVVTHSETVKGEPITGGHVRFRGRAAEKLVNDELPSFPWDSFTECPDEDFVSIGRLHLDPYGNLYPCQGVVVGNLNRATLADIVREYSPESRSIIGPIMRGGPAELVRAYGLDLHGQYHDACHLCYAARKQLRHRFPDDLSPPLVYGEE